jgi:hypothetical protein
MFPYVGTLNFLLLFALTRKSEEFVLIAVCSVYIIFYQFRKEEIISYRQII